VACARPALGLLSFNFAHFREDFHAPILVTPQPTPIPRRFGCGSAALLTSVKILL
jgi:hypothetical protein